MSSLSPLDPGIQCILGENYGIQCLSYWTSFGMLSITLTSLVCAMWYSCLLTRFLFCFGFQDAISLIPVWSFSGSSVHQCWCCWEFPTFSPLTLYLLSRWTHVLFRLQLLSNNSQIRILAQTSCLRCRHFYSSDCWANQQFFNCLLCSWSFPFSIRSSHFWQ